ncbi:MAG: hypothetical protein ACP5LX_04505 [Nitrososphaeria archaeon]|jgi:hypothetical protein
MRIKFEKTFINVLCVDHPRLEKARLSLIVNHKPMNRSEGTLTIYGGEEVSF